MSRVDNLYGLNWPDERIAELKRLFEAGLNNPQMAKEMGVTKFSIIGKLRRLGLKNRPPFWTDERIEELKRLFDEKLSAAEIAAVMGNGLSRCSILGKCFRLGLKRGHKEIYRKASDPRKPKNRTKVTRYATRWGAYSVETKPGVLPPEPAVDVVPLHISLAELNSKTCRWPYGDGPFTFCGHEPLDGPYCFAHTSLAIGKGTAGERSAARVLEKAA